MNCKIIFMIIPTTLTDLTVAGEQSCRNTQGTTKG